MNSLPKHLQEKIQVLRDWSQLVAAQDYSLEDATAVRAIFHMDEIDCERLRLLTAQATRVCAEVCPTSEMFAFQDAFEALVDAYKAEAVCKRPQYAKISRLLTVARERKNQIESAIFYTWKGTPACSETTTDAAEIRVVAGVSASSTSNGEAEVVLSKSAARLLKHLQGKYPEPQTYDEIEGELQHGRATIAKLLKELRKHGLTELGPDGKGVIAKKLK